MSHHIKGGGRACLSQATQDALVDCLMKRHRDRRADTTRGTDKEATTEDSLSEHARQRERKRFLKRLVETYQRKQAHESINQQPVPITSTASAKSASVTTTATATTTSATSTSTSKSNSSSSAKNVSGKVRVELVEAMFAKGSDKKTSTKAKKTKDSFKAGPKKLLVLPRSTTVPDLLEQAKTKLSVKRTPVRAFVLATGKTQQQVNLETNLAGIKDGTCLYVTSSPEKKEDADTSAVKNEEKEDGQSRAAEQEEEEEDPLDAVKKVYASNQRRRNMAQRRKQNTLPADWKHPSFSKHFDALPVLSATAAQLPVAHARRDILQAVQHHRVVIVCGQTGCGKSTQLPQFLWQGCHAVAAGNNHTTTTVHANIVVTQPRRVAATALARRVAEEMTTPAPGKPGSLVGYHVKLDRAISDDTAQIVYCTVGILLRQLVAPLSSQFTEAKHENGGSDDDVTTTASPPSQHHIPLSNYTHIVIDEVHERDVQTDFLLTLIRGMVLPHNPQLRVVLMSATASADLFAEYFSKYQPAVLTIPGRTFPVQTQWLADCQRLANRQVQYYQEAVSKPMKDVQLSSLPTGDSNTAVALSPRAMDPIDNTFIEYLIAGIVRKQQVNGELASDKSTPVSSTKRTDGAILVFLPGKGEIEALFRVLTAKHSTLSPIRKESPVHIHRLYSGVSWQVQQAVFEPADAGSVKVILSTNVAETSITIPDVSHVVDTGRVKESRYNAGRRIQELVTVWTSQASAQQRAGRAGRTTAGVSYRLYSQRLWQDCMPEFTPPEMIRTPLDDLVLQLCLLYEQRRDQVKPSSSKASSFPKGANPLQFLNQVPEPPSTSTLEQSCQHLLNVDALHVVEGGLYRLTPLGFHLSRLPMDAKVGKVLIVGCLLGCLDNALTIAATLSSSKSPFYHVANKSMIDRNAETALDQRARLIEEGFGGQKWKGGTAKGDLIAAIACYREWSVCPTDQDRFAFAKDHALHHVGMKEISELRDQYLALLKDAGFVSSAVDHQNHHVDDALLTTCCLVAGLYPNVCTLMRPRKGGPKGGRLLTKAGDTCRPHIQSFQRPRVQRAAETGKDAYAVYHSQHRTLATSLSSSRRPPEVTLSDVNFISRYALLLFSGELQMEKNAVILDEWLKFKIGEKELQGGVLLLALRDTLDANLLRQISGERESGPTSMDEDDDILQVVRTLLQDE
eukprot:scaffold34803_cov199-Amphora_coffeaeformis.AAC.1